LINDADIVRDAGLNPVTGKFYRNILKMMFIAFDVPPWYRNIGKRMVKSPKGYILDTLLLCHLLDLDLKNLRHNRPDMFGRILENYVATELIKLLGTGKIKAQLFYFRTSDGREIDFILERPDGSVFGIEVKNSELVHQGDFKGLKLLAELAGKDFIGGVVLYAGKDALPFGEKLWAVPVHVLWQ
jgi:uncharacterized protein